MPKVQIVDVLDQTLLSTAHYGVGPLFVAMSNGR